MGSKRDEDSSDDGAAEGDDGDWDELQDDEVEEARVLSHSVSSPGCLSLGSVVQRNCSCTSLPSHSELHRLGARA